MVCITNTDWKKWLHERAGEKLRTMRFLRSTGGPVQFVIESDDTEDVADLCGQLARQSHVDEEE